MSLNDDSLYLIFQLLEYQDLCQCAQVCKRWKTLADVNVLWDRLCAELWEDKVFIPKKSKELRNKSQAKKAFQLSIEDSTRCSIEPQELCVEISQWWFRFKESAGEVWLNFDPWWAHKPATQVRFGLDGNVEWVRPGRDIRQLLRGSHSSSLHQWSYVDDDHSTIRVNSYPTYKVSRYAKNWGYVMESCWVFFTSFPMPLRGEDKDLEDSALKVSVVDQLFQVISYNTLVNEMMLDPITEEEQDYY